MINSGYRLQYLEVFNWGTFDGRVFTLAPGGHTSLLTGANGSGKTTLVDALLTLLVPNRQRFYNQSSGSESKKERDENSYFWGFYGKSFDDADERSKTEQLRKKDGHHYSVLLANFSNEGSKQDTTLVQVRWFANGAMQKVFIVSPHALHIKDHFGKGGFDTKGVWKRSLQQQFAKTDIFSSFKDYAARFSEIFGLRDKALPLFGQTVGIKVLGDLTQFIRTQMLEEPDAETQFNNLHEHYTDLLLSHRAIKKDEKQLVLLEPIVQSREDLEDLQKAEKNVSVLERELPWFLNETEAELLEMNAREIEAQLSLLEEEKNRLTGEISTTDKERTKLISQKASLSIDNLVEQKNQEILSHEDKKQQKQRVHQKYLEHGRSLGLPPATDERSFLENLQLSALQEKEYDEQLEELNGKKFTGRMKITDLKASINDLQAEMDSLAKRRNRMPQDLIQIREELIELLEVTEEILPFVGELMQVKPECLKWEQSIERVLHGFATQLLVPVKYHKRVNEYVHGRNLGTRLVYQRVEERITNTQRWPNNEDSMLQKLDFKEDTPYLQWLENQLVLRYNYTCTDNMEVFQDATMAITSKGLVRSGNRHEKDDRPNRWNGLQYRLGWENKSLIRLLYDSKKEKDRFVVELQQELDAITPQISKLEAQKKHATLLLAISTFQDIDHVQHARQIEVIKAQIKQLMESSDKYQVVVQQLKTCEEALKRLREQEKDNGVQTGLLKKQYTKESERRLELIFDELSEQGRQMSVAFLEEALQTSILPRSVEELGKIITTLHVALQKKGSGIRNELASVRERILKLIGLFVNPSPAILLEFPEWEGDVMNLNQDIGSIHELEDLYQTIKLQRLVENKKRFRDYMDNSMVDALTNFREWMNHEEDKIREMIDDLNQPLKKISFNQQPETYLQLECRPSKDQQVREFREKLKEAVPDYATFASQKEEAYRDSVFLKIKTLIDELKKEEVWRRKVTDVRNRLVFNAREFSSTDHKPGQFHEDTASYSGGQKAQFTYAILGAAIAHQFGIFSSLRAHKSLRFITVDEAFSKLDPEKSEFLMKFCAQLDLQLLVVTPLDKISIAEEYINAVHFVEIKDKKYSNVYNLTLEEYQTRKEEFRQLGEKDHDHN